MILCPGVSNVTLLLLLPRENEKIQKILFNQCKCVGSKKKKKTQRCWHSAAVRVQQPAARVTESERETLSAAGGVGGFCHIRP